MRSAGQSAREGSRYQDGPCLKCVNSADGSVGLLGHIRIDQRHGATLCPHQLAGNPASPFQQILEPHQIVQHGDDAASGQAVVDAALKIVGTIVPQNGGQTLLPSNLAFMHPLDGLTQLPNREICVFDTHAKRGSGDHAAGRARVGIQRSIPQGYIKVEMVVEDRSFHGNHSVRIERNVNKADRSTLR